METGTVAGVCAECGGSPEPGDGFSVLARWPERRVCGRCHRKLRYRFALALALLGFGVALSSLVVDMPAALFVAFGGGLILIAGWVYWRARRVISHPPGGPHPFAPLRAGSNPLPSALGGREREQEGAVAAGEGIDHLVIPSPPQADEESRLRRGRGWTPLAWLAGDVNARFHGAVFGTWLAAYYVANLACGEWNPLDVGCNSTCKVIMWGSLSSMAALSVTYLTGRRWAIWPMLGVTVVQMYPHCQCENGFYIAALGVQPFCLIVPTVVGLTNLWMLGIGRYKPLGFALTLSLLAGAFAVAVTHRLGIPITWRAVSNQASAVSFWLTAIR